MLVVTLLHNTVGSVLCRYLGHYSAAQYCRQRTLQISLLLLCCTILQAAYYDDILVITLLHNIVGSVLGRYLGYYSPAQYCSQCNMQISWSLLCCTILQAAYYVISWSLLCCTILQTAYYVDNLIITLLHNTVGSVLCRYLDSSVLCRYLCRYIAAQYCRQRTMQISCQLHCFTILQSAYYVDILVITLLHNIVGSVL